MITMMSSRSSYKSSYSPTPIPRRKFHLESINISIDDDIDKSMIHETSVNYQSDIEQLLNSSLFNDSAAFLDMQSELAAGGFEAGGRDKSLDEDFKSVLTGISNLARPSDQEADYAGPKTYLSTTMPMPRKPRKSRILSSQDASEAESSETRAHHHVHQTATKSHDRSKTLQVSRSRRMQRKRSPNSCSRPSAPPPPLPSQSPSVNNSTCLLNTSSTPLISNHQSVEFRPIKCFPVVHSLKKQRAPLAPVPSSYVAVYDKATNRASHKLGHLNTEFVNETISPVSSKCSRTEFVSSTPATVFRNAGHLKKSYMIGFENLNRMATPSSSLLALASANKPATIRLTKWQTLKQKLKSFVSKMVFDSSRERTDQERTEYYSKDFKRTLNRTGHLFGLVLFLACITFIVSFQTQVHHFYQKFLVNSTAVNDLSSSSANHSNLSNATDTLDSKERQYLTAGSHLVKQTVLFCNGPLFSYQINNLIVLPFSLLLTIIFSLFSRRQSPMRLCCSKKRLRLCSRRLGLPGSVNPFQRRNRFLVAAFFCILANEIFKMIESSLFDDSAGAATKLGSFNSTTDLLNSILAANVNHHLSNGSSVADAADNLLRIGLGIQPDLLDSQKSARGDLSKLILAAVNGAPTTPALPITSKSLLMLAPSVVRYSKPRLPPRLNLADFESTATFTSTTSTNRGLYLDRLDNSADANLTLSIIDNVNRARRLRNNSISIIDSFNRTLNGSSSKTLFEVSMSLYHNEYVQSAVNTLFKSRGLKWTLILEKLRTIGVMLFEVFVIGLRYYPLLDVLEKDSIVCLALGTVYMWFDILYNVVITGLCEGLRLNVSFDLLKDVRRIFGVGFIYDVKERIQMLNKHDKLSWLPGFQPGGAAASPAFDLNDSIDTKLLFSTNRILYTVIKSLPHFFCLSYITVRLTVSLVAHISRRFKCRRQKSLSEKVPSFMAKAPRYSSTLQSRHHFDQQPCRRNLNLLYAKDRFSQISSVKPSRDEVPLSFEDRYVKRLFKPKRFGSLTLSRSSNLLRRRPEASFANKASISSVGLIKSAQSSHNLFVSRSNRLSTRFQRFKARLGGCFNWAFDENFRFSTRVVCTYTVCFTVLYYLTCFLVFYGSIFIDMIFLPNEYKYALITSTVLTALICFVQLILSIKQFKFHLQSLYSGTSERYISPKSVFSNRKIATSSFDYAGYVVTYTTWGYIILFIVCMAIVFQLATVVVFGSSTLVFCILAVILPFAISVVVIKLISKYIGSITARLCFTQYPILALKNLRSYSAFLYFKFFYDCFTGIAHCMLRMLKSIFFGILFMPRVDYSFMGRSLEKMDAGFMSYVGFLHWESHHTNPVMISFCDMLRRSLRLRQRQIRRKELSSGDLEQLQRRNRAINRWRLLLTLARNPQLTGDRKAFIEQQNRDLEASSTCIVFQ